MAVVPKRGRGRPTKLKAVHHTAQTQKIDLFEDITLIMPDLVGNLKKMALDPSHRQNLSAIKELMNYHAKFLDLLDEEEKEESQEQKTPLPTETEGDNIPVVNFGEDRPSTLN